LRAQILLRAAFVASVRCLRFGWVAN